MSANVVSLSKDDKGYCIITVKEVSYDWKLFQFVQHNNLGGETDPTESFQRTTWQILKNWTTVPSSPTFKRQIIIHKHDAP
jgi:hypothetical protein